MRDPHNTDHLDRERAANELQIRHQEQRDIQDFQWLMSQAQGQRFVWRLLEKAGVYRSTFNSSGSITAFNEGQRAIGLWVMGQIHDHTPDALSVMVKTR